MDGSKTDEGTGAEVYRWGLRKGIASVLGFTPPYIVCPKSNASDFFAQPRMARKGKWESWQVEEEPTCTVGTSSVELAPL